MIETKKLKKIFQTDEVETTARNTHSPHDASFANRIINLFDGKVVTEKINEEFHI
jgi:putative ABC transport system ATP-binding protein